MPVTITTPLVGAYHRPPAKQVLTVLPLGTPLQLVPEPDNPYDPGAIKVLVQLSSTFPVSRISHLTEALSGTGHDAVELVSSPEPLHLGYIPQSGSKTCQGSPGNIEVAQAIADQDPGKDAPSDRPFTAHLGAATEGHPTVVIQVQDGAIK